MKRPGRAVAVALLVLAIGLGASCSREILYSVSVANYGEYGVVLRNLPVRLNRPVNIEPGIPGVRDDIYEKSYFRGYPDSMPDQVEVVWQLATLKDCKRLVNSVSRIKGDGDPRVYTRQSGCSFLPIEGKVFRKVVDLKEIMKTEAGQRAGKLINPWRLSNARYGLSIAFEFRDEELKVRALTYRTNPWQ